MRVKADVRPNLGNGWQPSPPVCQKLYRNTVPWIFNDAWFRTLEKQVTVTAHRKNGKSRTRIELPVIGIISLPEVDERAGFCWNSTILFTEKTSIARSLTLPQTNLRFCASGSTGPLLVIRSTVCPLCGKSVAPPALGLSPIREGQRGGG